MLLQVLRSRGGAGAGTEPKAVKRLGREEGVHDNVAEIIGGAALSGCAELLLSSASIKLHMFPPKFLSILRYGAPRFCIPSDTILCFCFLLSRLRRGVWCA